MARQKGEENFTDREIAVLDATDEWHESVADAAGYTLVEYVAKKLSISNDEAYYELYGKRTDGALL